MPDEIKNQCAHCIFGLMISTGICFFAPLWTSFIAAGVLGLSIEIWQYFFNDNKILKIKDRAVDFSFYIVGALLFNLIVRSF